MIASNSGFDSFSELGINGKNSEFHAAMGIVNLGYIDNILESRKIQASFYDSMLANASLKKPKIAQEVEFNHSYYPVVFESEEILLKVKKELELEEIFPRRYFYPTLSSLNYVEKNETPIADDIAKRILCLPMYFELGKFEVEMICRKVLRVLNNLPLGWLLLCHW